MEQCSDVALDGALADELMPDKVGIMRGRDIVVRQWPAHVVVDATVLVCEGGVVGGEKELPSP